MNRHKALLTLALLGRLLAGFASLFLLARTLGPADYGVVATVFAYAAIVSLLTDFGFPVTLLRDIGAQPEKAGEFLAAGLRVKTLLAAIASFILLGVLITLRLDAPLFWSSICVHLAVMAASYGDLALIALRGLGRYDREVILVWSGTILFAAILLAAAWSAPALLPMALALLLARLVQTGLAFAGLRNMLTLRFRGPILPHLRSSASMAADTFLTALSGQVDVILVSLLLGLEATGLYQLGARIASYALLPSQVLAGVYTPALSALHFARKPEAPALEARMRLEFPLGGLLFGGAVAGLMPFIAPWLFGPAFALPTWAWPGFGAFIFARFATGALGIALVARRMIRARLLGQSLGLAFLCAAMVALLPAFGMAIAPWLAAAATALTAAVYAVALLIANASGRRGESHWPEAGALAVRPSPPAGAP